MGIDIVRVARIAKLVQDEHFLARVFTDGERSYAANKANEIETLAGIFAAKEAVVKCYHGRKSILGIEILHEQDGAPYCVVAGERVSVSISHDGEYAVAMAVRIQRN